MGDGVAKEEALSSCFIEKPEALIKNNNLNTLIVLPSKTTTRLAKNPSARQESKKDQKSSRLLGNPIRAVHIVFPCFIITGRMKHISRGGIALIGPVAMHKSIRTSKINPHNLA